MIYTEMSLACQAAFSGLDEAARQADLTRTTSNVPGGFAKKEIKGKNFWYHQIKQIDGTILQSYIGPDDEKTRSIIEKHRDLNFNKTQDHLIALSKSCVALGCSDVAVKHARVVRRLADVGLFATGAILVGTHAFLAYQNMLGVRWSTGYMTQDLDFAHVGNNLSLALPSNWRIDVKSAIESLEMGFLPNISGTTFKKSDEPDFDLDFLTVLTRSGDIPVNNDQLGIKLQPLKFMEFSMEDTVKSTLVSKTGPIVVNLPNPARYAIHKLIVASMRPINQQTKAKKDVIQASCLIKWYLDNDPSVLSMIIKDAWSRGPSWRNKLFTGSKKLQKDLMELFPTAENSKSKNMDFY